MKLITINAAKYRGQSCRPLIASAPAQSASDERRSCFSPLNLAAYCQCHLYINAATIPTAREPVFVLPS